MWVQESNIILFSYRNDNSESIWPLLFMFPVISKDLLKLVMKEIWNWSFWVLCRALSDMFLFIQLVCTFLGLKYISLNIFMWTTTYEFNSYIFTDVGPYFPLVRFMFYRLKSCSNNTYQWIINTLVIFLCDAHINWRVVVTLGEVIVLQSDWRLSLNLLVLPSVEPQALWAAEPSPTDVTAIRPLTGV